LDSDLVVLRQEVEVANNQPALLAARNNQELSMTLLKDSLGLDIDAPVLLVGSLEGPQTDLSSYEDLQASALARNPDYQAARRQLDMDEALISVSKAGRWPSLSLYSDYQWYSESDFLWPKPLERGWSSALGLRLNYAFFTGGQTSAKIDEARSQRDQARTALDKVGRGIRVEVKREWLAVQEAWERAVSQEAAIGQARRALEATEIRYRAGEASLLEQNDATLALQQTRLLHANALHDYRAALAALERAVGGPVTRGTQ
jgi:outer membrane protein TolC